MTVGTPARDEGVPQDLELGPGRHFAPVDDRDRRRRRRGRPTRRSWRAAPSASLSIGAVDTGRACRSRNRSITGKRVEQLAEPLRVAEAGRRLGVVLGEVQRRRAAGTRPAATPCWRCVAGLDARRGRSPARSSRARRAASATPSPPATTRSPAAASVSAAMRIRCSSASVSRNGRRNGQWTRSPNVSFRSRSAAAKLQAGRPASARHRPAAASAIRPRGPFTARSRRAGEARTPGRCRASPPSAATTATAGR